MTFSDEDKILIKSLHLSKGYNASRLLAEFPDKGWTKHCIKGCFRSSEKLVGLLLTDVNQLKQRLIDTWLSLYQGVIDDAIDQWRVRLRACVKAKDVISSTCCSKLALFRATQSFQKKTQCLCIHVQLLVKLNN